MPYRASCAQARRNLPRSTRVKLACLCPQHINLTIIPTLEPLQQTSSQRLITSQLLLLSSTNLRLDAQHTLGKKKLQLPCSYLLLFGAHDRTVPHNRGEGLRDGNSALLRNPLDRRDRRSKNSHQVWKHTRRTGHLDFVEIGRAGRYTCWSRRHTGRQSVSRRSCGWLTHMCHPLTEAQTAARTPSTIRSSHPVHEAGVARITKPMPIFHVLCKHLP